MATLGANYPTLLEVSKEFGVNGEPLPVAELLTQANEALDDIPWFEANSTGGHRISVTTGLPTAVYRKLNAGILPSKGTSTDLTESMGSLTSLGKVDKLLAEQMAQSDPLTGLHNRRGFTEQAATIWSTAVRNRRPLSLIMLDLDHFKDINDRFGHDAGDLALEQTARLLERTCRSGDVLARWGGEEFLLLLPETGLAEARALAERLRLEVQELALAARDHTIVLSASFGVIERSTQDQLEQLINQTDRLLYRAKHAGRNQVFAEA